MENVSDLDRVVRTGLGMLLIATGFLFTIPPFTWVAFVLGGWALGTGVVGYSPIYSVFGWSTATKRRSAPARKAAPKRKAKRASKKPKSAAKKKPARRAKKKPATKRKTKKK